MYAVAVIGCFLEAYFYSELDPESKKFLEEREKNRKNGNKRNS